MRPAPDLRQAAQQQLLLGTNPAHGRRECVALLRFVAEANYRAITQTRQRGSGRDWVSCAICSEEVEAKLGDREVER
jgi:hypothetical protein